MLKKDDKVILHNRDKREFGKITKVWRRKSVFYFNVQTERGVELENVTMDQSMPCYINQELSIKLNENKITQCPS